MWNRLQQFNDKQTQVKTLEQQAYINGLRVDLPFKPQRILMALLETAPHLLTREQLINDHWGGNFITGEKGLTQALWMIRAQLQELGGNSEWITTIPRYGYQWVGPMVRCSDDVQPQTNNFLNRATKPLIVVLSSCAILVALIHVSEVDVSFSQTQSSAKKIVASNGTYAYFDNDNLTVQHIEGCIIKLEPTSGSRLISPVFSDDGTKLAINILDQNGCRMRVVEFKTREVEEFNYCLESQSI